MKSRKIEAKRQNESCLLSKVVYYNDIDGLHIYCDHCTNVPYYLFTQRTSVKRFATLNDVRL